MFAEAEDQYSSHLHADQRHRAISIVVGVLVFIIGAAAIAGVFAMAMFPGP